MSIMRAHYTIVSAGPLIWLVKQCCRSTDISCNSTETFHTVYHSGQCVGHVTFPLPSSVELGTSSADMANAVSWRVTFDFKYGNSSGKDEKKKSDTYLNWMYKSVCANQRTSDPFSICFP